MWLLWGNSINSIFFLQEVKFFIKFDQCLKFSYDSFFEENNYDIFKTNMKEFYKNSNLEIPVIIKYKL